MYVSRDVTFEERKAWPWNDQKETDASYMYHFTIPDVPVDSKNEVERHEDLSGSDETEAITPVSRHSNTETYDDSVTTRKFKSIADVYRDTEEVEIEDELLLMGIDEPSLYIHVVKDKAWRQAMQSELESIEKNRTWELTDLPPGHKEIGLKWIFKLKKDADGNILKHKARLVAKGYVQEKGVDFDENFAPVTRLETVRLLLALAAKNSWEVHHLDVKTAFLNGEICEEVYVAQPEGFVKKGQEKRVYKLLKALYGLRQAPRAWYSKLHKYLENLGFKRSPFEHTVYIKREGKGSVIVGVYVDDLLVTGTDISLINRFKVQMSNKFEMSDMGKLTYHLGIEVKQGSGFIELKQSGYAKKIVERAGMAQCNPCKFPMDPKERLTKDENGRTVDATHFKSVVGGLRYLVHTRPDIAFSVGIVSRFMERPTTIHLDAAKRILRYIKGTLEYGLVYTKYAGNNALTGYSDTDLAGHIEDRKSTGGMVFYLNESLVTWVSQKQRCVALSSCEAEFMAASAAACQAIWLRNVLKELTGEQVGPVLICIDNKSAIDLAKNSVFHGRSKHIDIRYHFIRECIERGEVVVKHVSSEIQKADLLTKAFVAEKFERMRSLLGIKVLNGQV